MYIKRQTKVRNTKNFKEVTIQIHRDDKAWLSTNEVLDVYNSIINNKPKAKIRIRGLASTRWTTLSTYKDGLTIQADEDYWAGKPVDDTAKFSDFGILQVTVYLPK
jgi:hypothetical protein